jgi:signal transduction histidine kinase
VIVRAHNEAGVLRVTVEDTGRGFAVRDTTAHDGIGMGLANVRRRLNLCYGPGTTLEVFSAEFGSKVTFAIPTAIRSQAAEEEMRVSG